MKSRGERRKGARGGKKASGHVPKKATTMAPPTGIPSAKEYKEAETYIRQHVEANLQWRSAPWHQTSHAFLSSYAERSLCGTLRRAPMTIHGARHVARCKKCLHHLKKKRTKLSIFAIQARELGLKLVPITLDNIDIPLTEPVTDQYMISGGRTHLKTCGTAYRGCDPACPARFADERTQ